MTSSALGLSDLGRHASRVRARLRRLRGLPLYALLAMAGAFSALAHAPYHVLPALILGFVILILALDGARATARPLLAGFARAWAFGAGFFLAGTFWVANAFLVSVQDHAWLIWAPLTLLPGGLAIFWGVAGLAYVAQKRKGAARVAAFALAFLAVEVLRSTILSGFPWNLPGHVCQAGGAVSQSASLMGAIGLSALVLYAFASPVALIGRGRFLNRAYPMALSLVVVSGLWGWGAVRLSGAEVEATDVTIRLVQLDRPQEDLRPEQRDEILEAYLDHTLRDGIEQADLVIWPEGSIPAYLLAEPTLMTRIHDSLPLGTRLVAGAPHIEWGPDRQPSAYYNSLHALQMREDTVLVEARYDKARLVPFGEANTLAAFTRPFGLETLSQY